MTHSELKPFEYSLIRLICFHHSDDFAPRQEACSDKKTAVSVTRRAGWLKSGLKRQAGCRFLGHPLNERGQSTLLARPYRMVKNPPPYLPDVAFAFRGISFKNATAASRGVFLFTLAPPAAYAWYAFMAIPFDYMKRRNQQQPYRAPVMTHLATICSLMDHPPSSSPCGMGSISQ